MDFGHGKMRMNVEGDRLSSLPDDLIHKILSFIDIKEAIGTSVLSCRWRFIWKSMPYLNFSTEDFSTLPKFSKFVTNVLSRRDNLAEVYLVKLNFRVNASYVLLKRILNYAFSHNIQELNVECLLEKNIEFPLSLFSSQSLKHLSLKMQIRTSSFYGCFTSTWELPSLTSLDLHSVTLCDGDAGKGVSFLSQCANLKNLKLNGFRTTGSNGLSIVHAQLSNLTLEKCCFYAGVVNVVAPQLENLTIKYCYAKHVVSAPNLASLWYEGSYPLQLSTEGFHSLKEAHIYVSYPRDADAHGILCLLLQLHSVEFLKLNLEIVEILSSSVDLILHQPSPFVNLKSLKIYPERVTLWNQAPKKVAMPAELKSFLLDSSPGATFTMVLREEIIAHEHMAKLRLLLDKEMMRSHKPKMKKKVKNGGKMAQVQGYWKDLGVQIELRKKNAGRIISKLKRIEELLTTLPASNMAKIQPSFSSLCAEADIAISKITNCMKIQCDENQIRSSDCLLELATKFEPSA